MAALPSWKLLSAFLKIRLYLIIWALYYLRHTNCSWVSFLFLKFKYFEPTFHVQTFKQNVLSGSIVKFQIVSETSTNIFFDIFMTYNLQREITFRIVRYI